MKGNILLYSLAAMLALGAARPILKGAPRTGALGGEVTDPSGSVVPGATILLSSGHWSQTLSTDETGQYVVTGLVPGTYEVLVSSDGFASFDRTGLVVSAGETTKMDAALDLAVLKQEITVTDDAQE